MLNVYRSNKLEVLAEILVKNMGLNGAMPADPFTPLRVVVGSRGMERWLRHRLASGIRGHISANLEFPLPQQVLAQALALLEGQSIDADPPQDPWRPGVLLWALLELFPVLLEGSRASHHVAPLRAYLDGEPAPHVGPRSLELAAQIADIFDRLVVFRPQLALDWSRGLGTLPQGAGEFSWQPLLWHALQEHMTRESAGEHSALRWKKAILNTPPDHEFFQQPLRLFGISWLPPQYLHRLEWLSRHFLVELYMVCPSNLYWAELSGLGRKSVKSLLMEDRDLLSHKLGSLFGQRPHPLLMSMGRVGRDMQLVLESLGDAVVDRADEECFLDPAPQLTSTEGAWAEAAPDDATRGNGTVRRPRALHVLQSDILHLRDPSLLDDTALARRRLATDDDSIQFHSCYGPTRQVEVLREALLHLFQAHPDLEPRDVLVMAPDMEIFVPIIGAVFDQGHTKPIMEDASPASPSMVRWGEPGAPHIPYTVMERSGRQANAVADLLLRVLELASDRRRISSVTVLYLLAIEPFRRRFGIQADDLDTLRRWIEEAGIRWGLDAGDRARLGQPHHVQNTWRFGLERLALGVTMADSPGRVWDIPQEPPEGERGRGLVPFDGIEGGMVHLLGRFFDACTTIFDVVTLLRSPATIQDWLLRFLGDPAREPGSPAAMGILKRLCSVENKDAWLLARTRQELVELEQAAQSVRSKRTVLVGAMYTLLSRRFEEAPGAARSHTGALTFAAMRPYRSVPYRVICLLGMDEGAFPRQQGSIRFDPTQLRPQPGDRDLRDEDRYLLLEALLAAGDHFLVFYTGCDPRSNEPRAPAVPIGELRDVLDASFPAENHQQPSERMSRSHPLQAFSPRCFQPGRLEPGDTPWSYDTRLLRAARSTLRQRRGVPLFFPPDTAKRTETSAGEHKPLLQLPLEELERFLHNPTRTLLTRTLNLYFQDDDAPLPHREPIEPGGLDRWLMSRRMMDQRLAHLAEAWEQAPPEQSGPIQPAELRLLAEGLLPLGSGGERWVTLPVHLVDGIMERLEAWSDGTDSADESLSPRRVAIDTTLEFPQCRVRLLGRTGPIWGGDQIQLGIGDVFGKARYRIGPWLRHLAWLLAEKPDHPRTVLLYGKLDAKGQGTLQVACFRLPVARGGAQGSGRQDDHATWARQEMRGLVSMYLQGMERPLPLFQQASLAFAKRCFYYRKQRFTLDQLTMDDTRLPPDTLEHIEAAMSAAQAAFAAGESKWSVHDMDDPWVEKVWQGRDPILDPEAGSIPLNREFARLALQLWQASLAAWSQETSRKAIVPQEFPRGGVS